MRSVMIYGEPGLNNAGTNVGRRARSCSLSAGYGRIKNACENRDTFQNLSGLLHVTLRISYGGNSSPMKLIGSEFSTFTTSSDSW